MNDDGGGGAVFGPGEKLIIFRKSQVAGLRAITWATIANSAARVFCFPT